MKNKSKVFLIIIVVTITFSMIFFMLNPMEFYSAVFLTWSLMDPEPCGKFMSENVYMLIQWDYLKKVIIDKDHLNELQRDYFEKKQEDIKKSIDRFDCVDVVENKGIVPLWPDIQKRALEVWKGDEN